MLDKLFEAFNFNKPIQLPRDNKTPVTNATGTDDQMENTFASQAQYFTQYETFKYPFTIEQHDNMTVKRCSDMGQLFNLMMNALTTIIR